MSIDQPNFEPQWSEFLQKIKDRALDDTRELWYNRAKERLENSVFSSDEIEVILKVIFKKE